MKVERYELEEKLIPVLVKYEPNKKVEDKVKELLAENHILGGKVAWTFNQPESIKAEDIRYLCLLTSALYKASKEIEIDPQNFFTDREIKEAQSFSGESKNEDSLFPVIIEGVLKVDDGVFKVVMNNHLINNLLVKGGLNYNFESQREATVKKKDDQIIHVPTVNNASIQEITEHLLNGTLVYTDPIINARLGTSDEGEEVIYDEENNKLMITEGTIIDIVDGYHRLKGNQTALSINPDINFNFPITIINTTVDEARRYVGQIGKANPISKARAKELAGTNFSALVVKKLRQESMLKGMISQGDRLIRLNKEIVTVKVLMDGIEEEFPTRNKMEAMDVGDYLVEFFDNLIGRFQDEFIDNYNEVKKTSLINHNLMFYGYIVLAKRFKEENKKSKNIVDIIHKIDFSKDNEIWENIGVIRNGKINYNRAGKAIKKYFKEIEL